MRRQTIARRMLIFVLAFMMMFPMAAMDSYAAVGTLSNVSTGLTGNIDTEDTVALPIKILDYEADGMLFEYAESNAYDSGDKDGDNVTNHDPKRADEFGAKYYYSFTELTGTTKVDNYESLTNVSVTDYWSDVAISVKTGTYANYASLSWVGNSTNDWRNSNAAVLLTDFKQEVSMSDV